LVFGLLVVERISLNHVLRAVSKRGGTDVPAPALFGDRACCCSGAGDQLPARRVDQLGPAEDRAGDEVRVPVQVLRRAVQREVEAAGGGAEVDGRGEGVVHEADEVVRAGEGDHRVEVRHLHERVGDGFDVDRAGGGRLPDLHARAMVGVGGAVSAGRAHCHRPSQCCRSDRRRGAGW